MPVYRAPWPLARDARLIEGRLTIAARDEEVPPDCTGESIAFRVADFFDAISAGDAGLVEEFFPAVDADSDPDPVVQDYFQHYYLGDGKGEGFSTRRLEELAPHLEQRFENEERIELRSINVGPPTAGARAFAPFGLRWAADLEPGPHVVSGKGVMNCETRKFIIMGIATDVPHHVDLLSSELR